MSRPPKIFAAVLVFMAFSLSAERAMAQDGEVLVRIPEGAGLPDGVIESAGASQLNLDSFMIALNPGSGLSGNAAALAAFQRGANRWMSRIADPITVNVNANLANLGGGGIIGSASSSLVQGGYSTIRNAMVNDAATDPADAVVLSLPTAAQFAAFLPAGFSLTGNIFLTTANAKALGLINATAGVDASITFNSQFAFDFDNSDGVTPGTIDFESVAAHEIGHALGFISGVDNIDGTTPRAVAFTPLDLFRFQNNVAGRDPSTTSEFTTFPRYLVPGSDAITDDLANEYRMSTGVTQGDGRQASHWKDDDLTGSYIGVMDPTTSTGVITLNTEADFRALSLIGYNVAPRAVPEPASLAMLGLGIIGVMWFARSRKTSKAAA